MWKQIWSDEHGNVSLIVACAMVAILGCLALVADVGMVYFQRQHLYAALDSGALAGIQRILFGEQDSETTARQYVEKNGEEATSIIAYPDQMKIDLSGTKSVDLSFAKVLGYNSMNVSANVEAQANVTVAGNNMVPIGVPNQTFQYGHLYTLTEGAGDGNSGNYNFLDFPGAQGASDLGDLIRDGYQGMLRVGQEIDTKPGVNHGPVSDAIQFRMDADSSCAECTDYRTASSGCRRILYLPVIDSFDVNGKKPVKIVGFAAFFLEGMSGNGGHQQIIGRFIRTIVPGESGTGTDYGLYSVKLTH